MRLTGRKSITFRLTLLFASVSTTVLLLLGLLIGALVERHFEELDMELLGGKLELVSRALGRVQSDRELASLPRQLNNAMVGHRGLALIVLTPGGQTLYSTAGAKFPEELLAEVKGKSVSPTLWTDSENHRYRGIFSEVSTGIEGATPLVVAVSTDVSSHEHFMYSFRTALWTVMGLAALLTGFLGWVAVRRGLAPLRDISRSAAGITANRLDQRLSSASIPAELAEVEKTLNEMLARLEESFRRLSDFSSDIAHELRTPVSNLMTQTQVVLSRRRGTDDYRGILESNAEEFERMARMISDMLLLAKAENGLVVPNREAIQLATEVKALFDYYDAVAEEKGLRLALEGNGQVSADRPMLRRALGNLLSNAVRHSAANTTVRVNISTSPDTVLICMENTGDAIAPEYWERVFDRFFRVDPSRQRNTEGTGLGLAITKSIIDAHGGTIFVKSTDHVTTFTIRLPRIH